MARVSKEVLEKRPQEILKALRKLYKTMSFNEITLKDISKETSFSRPSIYNYFETKEEIFLSLLKEEYDLWNSDLEKLYQAGALSRDAFSKQLANTLSQRDYLLKIQCMNLYEIEEHSRQERLTDFKCSYKRSMELVDLLLQQSFPQMSETQRHQFAYAFFPFMYGLYPFVYPTQKQLQAMHDADMTVEATTIFDITYHFIKNQLNEGEKNE